MQLSERLASIAALVTSGSRLADVGCDHGYLPIWLCLEKRIRQGLALDINRGPLERARDNIARYGLEDQIETRLSDGLESLEPGEVDSVVLAGMGGKLMIRILTRGARVTASLQELILEPQSHVEEVRRYLTEIGFRIVAEDMTFEDGKYYPVIRGIPDSVRREKGGRGSKRQAEAEENSSRLTDLQLKYGPVLLARRHPVLLSYLRQEEAKYRQLAARLNRPVSWGACARQQEIQEELRLIQAAYAYYEM